MSDGSPAVLQRRSFFDRIRGPMTLLLIGAGGFALYYYVFSERQTAYYSGRNGRIVNRLAQQIRRAVDTMGRLANNAASLPTDQIARLYTYEANVPDEHRAAQAIFNEVELKDTATPVDERRYARQFPSGLRLVFEGKSTSPRSEAPITLAQAKEQGKKDRIAGRTRPSEAKKPGAPQQYVTASIDLKRLMDTMVRQNAAGVFDTVFILDHGGNVIYQSPPPADDASDADLKIVRVQELRSRGHIFDKEQTVPLAELLSASHQLTVRIGNDDFQLFSVPLPSSIGRDPAAGPPRKEDVPSDLWVVCGLVSNGTFRASSLAISPTLLTGLVAAVLLLVFAWPFLKMALISAQHKVTLVDVILIGVSGILATALVGLIALDGFMVRRLESIGDEQLVNLASEIEAGLNIEIERASDELDAMQTWVEGRLLAAGGTILPRTPNLLALVPEGVLTAYPFYQSFSLLGHDARQKAKWTVDAPATPLVGAGFRTYFSAPYHRGPEYLSHQGRKLTIESIRSATSGQPEVVFSRRTDERPSPAGLHEAFPVIARAAAAVSVIRPVLPADLEFAIVDGRGMVLFHSRSERNVVENFFVESDENRELKSAVTARRRKTIDIRYWGEDYRAYVRPMQTLPWSVITFRSKAPMRAVNTEALTVTMILLLAMFGPALLLLIGLVLLFRPRYRAAWLWPDGRQVTAYAELAAAYLVLLAVAAVLLLRLDDATLVALPFAFVPLVLVIAYLYLKSKLRGAKRLAFVALDALFTAWLLVLMWREDGLLVAAAIALAAVSARAALRRNGRHARGRVPERQRALPLGYVAAGFLLLLLTSIVPAVSFFKAAYGIEIESYVKRNQMKLGRDLQNRWWRIAGEFRDERGAGKDAYLERRRRERLDLYVSYDPACGTALPPSWRDGQQPNDGLRERLEPILQHQGSDAIHTGELLQDGASDGRWWWTRPAPRTLQLNIENGEPMPSFVLTSHVPALLRRVDSNALLVALLALSVVGFVAFFIARFVARRIFLVDLVPPLTLQQGFTGLRHVICHPCDDTSARRLFRDFRHIDLRQDSGLAEAREAPQSFDSFESSVFVDGLGYPCASGERSELVRGLIDRLTRNSDRTVVIRPTALSVITRSLLHGEHRDEWARLLSSFVWVNWNQLVASSARLTLSGPIEAVDPDSLPRPKSRWNWRNFDEYVEQLADARGLIERTVKEETSADPYLQGIMSGLSTNATGRDQVLDEIGERAEEYYDALWNTCSTNEQLVLMQLAQTGLVNGKTRKDLRRLLARGLIRRDPQIRLMNETFRRFVLAVASSGLAAQLEHDLARDAWSRFRIPIFATVGVVLLFFFTTQRQAFDSTIALFSGLAATLPLILKTLSGLGDRGTKSG